MNIKITQSPPNIINLVEYNSEYLDIIIEKNQHLSCMLDQVQDWGPYSQNGVRNITITFHVQQNAVLDLALLITDAQHTKIDLNIILEGEHAQAQVRGLYVLSDSQKVTIITRQEHRVPSTKSDLNIKGLLNDASASFYQGTIFVHQAAKQTVAVQENKNMLLSRCAQAQSIPSLEVLTNDVSCKHGSAVGYFDEQALFYLVSRGLNSDHAKQVLLRGFCAEIIDTFPPDFVSSILKRIEEKML